MSIVDEVLSCTDDILSIRDDIGALKHPVYILTRSWSGTERGSGTATDSTAQILPSPWVVDFSHSLRVLEGGNIRRGDILLKTISKEAYREECEIDCSVSEKNQERWYFIDGKLYEVISVTSEYVYWNVQIRKTSKQKVYL
jgi:hypothetical protein